MASAAEQLAANINFAAFAKATELQKRIWFTIIALIVYRIGTFIPIPGVDPAQFAQAFQQQAGGILGMFNTFSGGAVERMAIFALNVMPYISSSIIMQLLSTSIPSLERLKKEGEVGRKQINQYTRYLTLLLAVVQSYGIAMGLQGSQGVVTNPGYFFIASTVITLTGGTMFLMWLGEQITARGVGNGVSLIIFAGIVADLPRVIMQSLSLAQQGDVNPFGLLMIAIVMLAVIVFVVFIERSQRRLVVQYPKRQQGNRMFMGESSFLPLKLNTAGVIPPIFASSLLMLPTTLIGFAGMGANAPEWVNLLQGYIGYGKPGHMILYAFGIIFFCFFYTSIVFNPEETADNLRKYGGFLPGIRPGKKTAEYLDYVLTRLTVIGAAYITAVCLLPEMLITYYAVPFYLGGTSILIVISVTLDTVAQIQSHLVAHQYEGLIKRSKLRGSGGGIVKK
ncbi:MAG: preprotein translocase subunit SecY [Caulobacteraceae bacterium]|nr:preprotein translocase subunit SecY [Caulobacteraceae bacterium]MBP6689662.1 preprotein translocase subunit SecY [Hyphomonadaceae bacterium]